jgi:hypothetical protein
VFVYTEESHQYNIYDGCQQENEQCEELTFRISLPYPLNIPIYFGDILITKSSQTDNGMEFTLHPLTMAQWRSFVDYLCHSNFKHKAEECDTINYKLKRN